MFLNDLRQCWHSHGKENIIYIDESGFEEQAFNPYAWSLKGQTIYGDKIGNHKRNRTNLIMGQRGKDWLAPVVFTGSCDHRVVETWLEEHLFTELENRSVIVLDNAPFHRKTAITALCAKYGHKALFLPP